MNFNWYLFKKFIKQITCKHPEAYSTSVPINAQTANNLRNMQLTCVVFDGFKITDSYFATPATCTRCGVVMELLIRRATERAYNV